MTDPYDDDDEREDTDERDERSREDTDEAESRDLLLDIAAWQRDRGVR